MSGTERTAESNDIVATYRETPGERRLVFEVSSSVDDPEPPERAVTDGRASTAAIAQNREGYAMLSVRLTPDGDELERYYGFEMALDHAAEVLGVDPNALPVPESAADMGM